MQTELLNTGLAFLEGFALIISPCILPILPIVLSGSLDGGKRRPVGIIMGFVLSFALFTFFAKKLVQLLGIDLNLVRYASFALLLLFGIVMLSGYLTEKFALLTQGIGNLGANIKFANNPNAGLLSGLVFGGLVGLVWTPCAGPILAAVIVQTVIQKTNWGSFLTLVAFAIGAATPMFLIVFFGRKIVDKFDFFKTKAGLFRKILGMIIILTVGFLTYTDVNAANEMALVKGLSNPYSAPEIVGDDSWINSPPLQISQLKGKVVLVDFWAYSCINCIRTLPYLNDWYKKYHDKGLVIIGVHTPEFDFERKVDNVRKAVQKFAISYPVVIDNGFATWQNYHNQYWPAHYLIDKSGKVVYVHFAEGDYDITENNIRFLLGINAPVENTTTPEHYSLAQTPETYLGYERAENFSSPEQLAADKVLLYSYPHRLGRNDWALEGRWEITAQKIIAAEADAAIKMHFTAGKVYVVMGSAMHKPIQVKALLNGEPITIDKGNDVRDSTIEVQGHTLYHVIELPHLANATLELRAVEPGLEVYTFTFGS